MDDYSIFLVIPLLALLFVILDNYTYSTYSYVDINGTSGIADYCYTDGSMYCRLEDNTTFQVVEFKRNEN